MKSENKPSNGYSLSRIPSLSALIAFERAASYSSFAKAADDLGRSPSTISHAINELEARLGCQLFRRIGRTVSLTPAGREYLTKVRQALGILESSSRNINGELDQNTIHVYLSPTFANNFLIPNLYRFTRKFPHLDVQLHIVRNPVDWSVETPDVEIRAGGEIDESLSVHSLLPMYLTPICSPALIGKSDAHLNIRNLENFTLITDKYRPDDWSNWLKLAGHPDLAPSRKLTFSDPHAIFEAARSGLGVAFSLYPFLLKFSCYKKSFLMPFPDSGMLELQYRMIYRKENERGHKISIFTDWLKKLFEGLISQALVTDEKLARHSSG